MLALGQQPLADHPAALERPVAPKEPAQGGPGEQRHGVLDAVDGGVRELGPLGLFVELLVEPHLLRVLRVDPTNHQRRRLSIHMFHTFHAFHALHMFHMLHMFHTSTLPDRRAPRKCLSLLPLTRHLLAVDPSPLADLSPSCHDLSLSWFPASNFLTVEGQELDYQRQEPDGSTKEQSRSGISGVAKDEPPDPASASWRPSPCGAGSASRVAAGTPAAVVQVTAAMIRPSPGARQAGELVHLDGAPIGFPGRHRR